MTLVSKNLRYLRRLHGLTQEEFSKKIGIKRSLLGAYEEERATPNLTNLINMTKVFDISMDEFVTLDIAKIRDAASLFPSSNTLADDIEASINAALHKDDSKQEPTIDPKQKKLFESTSVKQDSKANNKYPTLSNQLFTEAPISSPAQHSIVLVHVSKHKEYIERPNDASLETMPLISMSILDNHKEYRAFEMGPSFPQPQSILLCERSDIDQIQYDQHYVIIGPNPSIEYCQVLQNSLKTIELKSSNGITKINPNDIKELWIPRLCLSASLPSI